MLNERVFVELLGGREWKWCGVLEIKNVGVEWFCHCKWSKDEMVAQMKWNDYEMKKIKRLTKCNGREDKWSARGHKTKYNGCVERQFQHLVVVQWEVEICWEMMWKREVMKTLNILNAEKWQKMQATWRLLVAWLDLSFLNYLNSIISI